MAIPSVSKLYWDNGELTTIETSYNLAAHDDSELVVPANPNRVVCHFFANSGIVGNTIRGGLGSYNSAFGFFLYLSGFNLFKQPTSYDVENVGDVVTSGVYAFASGVGPVGESGRVIEVLCSSGSRPNNCGGNMAYDFRTASGTVATANTLIPIFPANSRRVALAVSVVDPTGAIAPLFALSANWSAIRNWMIMSPPINLSFPYRDYGPVIREQVAYYAYNVGLQYTITETWAIPSAR